MWDGEKITAPVSIEDVRQALGASSSDLGTLCRHPNINLWSKYKPVRRAGLTYLGANVPETYGAYADDGGIKGMYGIQPLGMQFNGDESSQALLNENGWGHIKPQGGMNSPYRLLDFLYYTTKKPYALFSAPQNVGLGKQADFELTYQDASAARGEGDVVNPLWLMDNLYFGAYLEPLDGQNVPAFFAKCDKTVWVETDTGGKLTMDNHDGPFFYLPANMFSKAREDTKEVNGRLVTYAFSLDACPGRWRVTPVLFNQAGLPVPVPCLRMLLGAPEINVTVPPLTATINYSSGNFFSVTISNRDAPVVQTIPPIWIRYIDPTGKFTQVALLYKDGGISALIAAGGERTTEQYAIYGATHGLYTISVTGLDKTVTKTITL